MESNINNCKNKNILFLAYNEYVQIHKGIKIIIPEVYSKWLPFDVTIDFCLLPTSSTAAHSWF